MSMPPGQKPADHEIVIITSAPAPAPAGGAGGPPVAPPAPLHNLIGAAQALGLTLRPMFPDATIHAPTLMATGGAPQNPELAAIEQEQKRFLVTHAATAEE